MEQFQSSQIPVYDRKDQTGLKAIVFFCHIKIFAKLLRNLRKLRLFDQTIFGAYRHDEKIYMYCNFDNINNETIDFFTYSYMRDQSAQCFGPIFVGHFIVGKI